MHRAPHVRPGVPSRRRFRRLLTGIFALGAVGLGAPAAGQEAPEQTAVQDTVRTVVEGGVSPRGAFLRAVALPGWGHASIGSYHRGAFYFVTEGTTAWTLLKTRRRFAEAQDRVRFQERVVRADLVAAGVTDEPEIQKGLDADPTLKDLKELEASRRQQREDWTAVGIFLLFLSGADAFVSAHLKDFPLPLELNALPVGDGRVELSVGITLPR